MDSTEKLELEKFQSNLKRQLRYLVSLLSVVLIFLGLYFLFNGIFSIINRQSVVEQGIVTEATIEVSNNPEVTGLPGSDEDTVGEILSGLQTSSLKAATLSAEVKANETAIHIKRTNKWRATDYIYGDIKIGKYTVKLGDTLWEISEAVYGDGNKWKLILDANLNSVGFLPNGTRALIMPGQILNINK